LDFSGRLVRHGVEAPAPKRPLEEEAGLPDSPPPPDDGEASLRPLEKAIEPLQFVASIEELHVMIMHYRIMRGYIIHG
jgi:hypothetical protein